MINVIKRPLILGIVWTVIKTVFKIIYKLLSFLNLQPTLFVALVGLVLLLTGLLKNSVVLTFLCVALMFSVAYAVIVSIKKLLGMGGDKPKKSKGVQIINETSSENAESVERKDSRPSYPKYYRVKQNAAYVMAEYGDRYELYLKTKNGLQKVRTDYKQK